MFLHNGEKPWLKKKPAVASESELGSFIEIDIHGQGSDAFLKEVRETEGGEGEEEVDEEEDEEEEEEEDPDEKKLAK